MEKLEQQKEQLKSSLGWLTDNCAYVKFNDYDVDYIRIDTEIFDDPKTMGQDVIDYASKMREAKEMAMQYSGPDDMGEHIDPLIMKYHPIWMFAREQSGFVMPAEGEENCVDTTIVRTYDEWLHDNFIAAGILAEPSPKIKSDTLMTLSVFESTVDVDLYASWHEDDSRAHPDLKAFYNVRCCQNSLADYQERKKNGKRNTLNLEGMKFKLSKDNFPLVEYNHNTYDFRRPRHYHNCLEKIHKKSMKVYHPQTQLKGPVLGQLRRR